MIITAGLWTFSVRHGKQHGHLQRRHPVDVLACIRAYELTGDSSFMTLAVNHFDAVYSRGSDSSIGAIWRFASSNTEDSTNALDSSVNGPAILTAYLIYDNGGGNAYLTKAENLFGWFHENLFNSSTGEVYNGINYPRDQDETVITRAVHIRFDGYAE
jgi:hypothetical protein